MDALTVWQARDLVLSRVRAGGGQRRVELCAQSEAAGRVLAEDVFADRDTPALSRSVRDGYAVRAADLPGELRVIGEVRAGRRFNGEVSVGEAVEIMTGAPVPAGANAVVMVEYAVRLDDRVRIDAPAEPGQFINPRGIEAAAGQNVLHTGQRLDYAAVAALAAFGYEKVKVFAKPVAAIIATGDEIAEEGEVPEEHQIRNSNAFSLASQVKRAGGEPIILPVARDEEKCTKEIIQRGLSSADMLLLSGGVSAGKYDIVKRVFAELGAEFYFERVLIQPGQPLVFGRVQDRFFFGLPGNPASTMVTFEVFARAAFDLLAGCRESYLRMPYARLTAAFRQRPGLTRFLPALLSADGGQVTPLAWSGSGDVPAMARANAYLVTEAGRSLYRRGAWIRILPK